VTFSTRIGTPLLVATSTPTNQPPPVPFRIRTIRCQCDSRQRFVRNTKAGQRGTSGVGGAGQDLALADAPERAKRVPVACNIKHIFSCCWPTNTEPFVLFLRSSGVCPRIFVPVVLALSCVTEKNRRGGGRAAAVRAAEGPSEGQGSQPELN